jgi:RNA polymerase sigma-70 factor (ECF subfamily)
MISRWEGTDDVVQGAAQRLYRALEVVVPESPRSFHNLCGEMIRRELLDLKRRLYGPLGIGANHASPSPDGTNAQGDWAHPHDSTNDPAALARWTELHETIERLPPELREAFNLIWYEGMTHADAALIVGVAEKTISRRWREARLRIHSLVEDGEI